MIGKRSVCILLASIAKVKVLPEDIDEILWPYYSNNSFIIRSLRQRFYDGGNCTNILAKAIWNSETPTKAYFFTWRPLK